MPTIRQYQRMREAEFEFPQTRREDDPMYISPKNTAPMQNKPLPQDLKEKIEQLAATPDSENPAFTIRTKRVKQRSFLSGAEALYNLMGEGGRWVRASERPLITRDEKGHWTCTEAGDKEFIAAVEYVDKNQPGKTFWWMKHCVIENETGLCVVGDIDNEPAPWEIDSVQYYMPFPKNPSEQPTASDRDSLVEALKKIDAKINTLIQEDPKGRAIEVAIIMANTLKEISGICTTALKTV